MTTRIRGGLPSLREARGHRTLMQALRAGSDRFGFRLIEFSVQTNHFHMLVEVPDQRALTRGAKGLFVRLARALNRLWRRRGQVFPERYHVRALTSRAQVRRALVYVLHNARKHRCWGSGIDPFSSGPWFDGYRREGGEMVAAASVASGHASGDARCPRARDALDGLESRRGIAARVDWIVGTTLSDGTQRWILGLPRLAELRASPQVTRRARTWLLARGWRSRGLLDPDEAPAG